MKPTVVLCVPTYNEEKNISAVYESYKTLKESVSKRVHLRLQFTDNSSNDNTWHYISRIIENDNSVRAFRFARNIGFQESIFFSFMNAKGDAVVQIDADLQDPMELVETFIYEWQNGAKVVSGVRIERQEGRLINKLRTLGYRIISRLSDFPIPEDIGDFRLIDAEVINALEKVKTPTPFIRAIISGFGFPEVKIPYSRRRRVHGKSKFSLFSLISFGLTGVVNHSRFATRLFLYLSILLLMVFFGYFSWVIFKILVGESLPAGYTSILLFVGFNGFIMTLGFSILSFYIYKIYLMLNGENQVYFQELPERLNS